MKDCGSPFAESSIDRVPPFFRRTVFVAESAFARTPVSVRRGSPPPWPTFEPCPSPAPQASLHIATDEEGEGVRAGERERGWEGGSIGHPSFTSCIYT